METRANYALIGVFTLAVVAAAFGFVLWFAGSDSGKDRPTYRIEFYGSVAGLSKGSPVLFNGIRVGDVQSVELSADAPDQAFATIQVAKTTPIRDDTRAALDVNLLSGVAQIALYGGTREAGPLQKRDAKDPYPTITADSAGLGSVIQTAKGTAEKASALLDSLNSLVNDNRIAINAAVRNVEAFSDALGKNAPALNDALASVGEAAKAIGPVATRIGQLSDAANDLVKAVEPDRVRNIVRNADAITQTVEDGRANITASIRDFTSLMGRLNDAAPRIQEAVTGLSQMLAGVDPKKLGQTIDNAQRFSEGLAASTADYQATMRNANSLSAKLDQSANRIDGVVKAVENFLGSAAGQEGKSTFAAIRQAMEAFGKASDNLNRRATEIATAISRVSGAGTRQVDALGSDARRAVNTIGRAAGNLEKNPSSVIFGTGRASIPEYSGR
jgi:phospholipid/cholesterol/gamma-HCH transport system substrate-binding protein